MESLRRRCWNREADESGFPYLSQMENTAEKVDAYLTLNCPLDELAILQLIMENPNITQKEIAIRIEKSERTVKNKVASLKEKGYIQRLNGKRSGKWEVLI
ncbi:MAG: winged helix-turn-helix domain-containing protein [Clostridia bacterium]|nr:winged helix-turn-helix domain-containing protein [Clostridia bacterium]